MCPSTNTRAKTEAATVNGIQQCPALRCQTVFSCGAISFSYIYQKEVSDKLSGEFDPFALLPLAVYPVPWYGTTHI